MFRHMQWLGGLALASALAGCGPAGPSGPAEQAIVGLNFATRPAGAPAAKAATRLYPHAASETIALGGDTLVVTQAELVLKHIEFKALGDSSSCEDSTGVHEGCHELAVGPMLVDLPLGGGAARQLLVAVQPGTYGEVEFEIHKTGHGSDEDVFLAAHPDLRDVSIRVTGTFDKTPFTYVTDVEAEQEQEFGKPLQVSAGSSLDVTLLVDLDTWFLDPSRSHLVDPASAAKGQPNEGQIDENIKRSFNAFRDDDRDGESDD